MSAFWSTYSHLLAAMAVYAMLGWSLYITMRVGSLFLGQPAAMAAGAYVSAWLSIEADVTWVGALAAGVVSGLLVAGLAGFLVRSMRPLYAALVSLALVEVVKVVIVSWSSVTGGAIGLIGVPLRTSEAQILLVAAAVGLSFAYLARTQLGYEFESVRMSDMAARALGRNVGRTRMVAFALSGAVAGLAGTLQVHLYSYTSPDAYTFNAILQTTTVAVVGGVIVWWGPFLGALFVVAVPELLDATPAQDYTPLIYGVVLILTLVVLPGGIASGVQRIAQFGMAVGRQLLNGRRVGWSRS